MTSDIGYGDGQSASTEVIQTRIDIDALIDKVEGLQADLESAVEVAYKRGAVDWCRLNYPEIFHRLEYQRLQGNEK